MVQPQLGKSAPPLQANELNKDKLRCTPVVMMCRPTATAVVMVCRPAATAATPCCTCRRSHGSRQRRRRGCTLAICKRRARRHRGCFFDFQCAAKLVVAESFRICEGHVLQVVARRHAGSDGTALATPFFARKPGPPPADPALATEPPSADGELEQFQLNVSKKAVFNQNHLNCRPHVEPNKVCTECVGW